MNAFTNLQRFVYRVNEHYNPRNNEIYNNIRNSWMNCYYYKRTTLRETRIIDTNINCLLRSKNDLFPKRHFTGYRLSGCSIYLERDLKAIDIGINDRTNFEVHLYL